MFIQILFIVLLLVVIVAKQFSRKLPVASVSPLIFTNPRTSLPSLLKVVQETNAKAVEVRGGNTVFFTHPDSVRDLLRHDVSNYTVISRWPKDTPMDLLMSNGIIFVNGDQWRNQRHTSSPAFQLDSLQHMVPIVAGKVNELIDILGDAQKDVDIAMWIHKFNLDAIGAAMFGVQFDIMKGAQGLYQQAFYELLHIKFPPMEILFPQIARIPTAENKARAKLVSMVLEMTENMVKQRKKSAENRPYTDVVDSVAESDLSDVEKQNLIFSLFLAGHHTTGSALAWAFHFLAKHQEYQELMYKEILEKIGDKEPSYENVKSLSFMSMFIKEVLRLCSPAPQLDLRLATETQDINGVTVPAGMQVSASFYVIHRLPEFWPEPDKFDPFRFTPELCKARHSYAYLPFSTGKRACIGKQLSLLQQKSFLAMMVRKYRIHYIRDAIPEAGIFYQPDCVRVRLEAR